MPAVIEAIKSQSKTVPEYSLLIKILRHQLDINKRRHDTYQAVAKKAKKKSKGCLEPLVRRAARNIDIEVNARETHTQRSSELAATLDQLERLGRRFSLLTENSPRRFC
ncbi:uncharacterized protein ARMOST_17397 [Armillaria ostoyae]|uniref:Uncharacterized protein n=1 Tax=Armillaria ostoyae TaxID=47428 RepID=A0A284RZ09_ARMOS|nr:uncharacterized protein ARMOST_17397 [Armillaria ostoyae]